jgi:ubiquinone/menaquinone biosynthesis C-methylase UbiE
MDSLKLRPDVDTFVRATEHHLRNEFMDAARLYVECIANNYRKPESLLYLGILYLQNGHRDQGLSCVGTAKELGALHVDANMHALDAPFASSHNREAQHFSGSPEPYPRRPQGTVDDWRHCRMLAFTKVFAASSDTWLTIGDHYGHDALRIMDHGATNVTPSSLSLEQLSQGKAIYRFKQILQLNAENLSLPDKSFDYVVCKEALHHMPRPYLAIYEMLRVARKAVFIVAEPSDPQIDWKPDDKPLKLTRSFFNDPRIGPCFNYLNAEGDIVLSKFVDWWESGPLNYVYTFSEREFQKLAQGYGLPSFGTGQLNDFFDEKWAVKSAREDEEAFLKTKEQIALHDRLCDVSGMPKSRVHGLLFRETPKSSTLADLISYYGIKVNLTRTRFMPFRWP